MQNHELTSFLTLPFTPSRRLEDGHPSPRVESGPVWVRELDKTTEAKWDQFVFDHPDGTLFHELAWQRAIVQGYGHRPCYLAAGRGTRMTGVLPLFQVSGPFTGRALISVPYGIYGGVLAKDRPTETALFDAARMMGYR